MNKLRRKLVGILSRRLVEDDNILTFTAKQESSTISINVVGSITPASTLEISTDKGASWLPYTVGDTITLANLGDSVKMRGSEPYMGTASNAYHKFSMTGLVAASGDVTSLMNGVGGDTAIPNYALTRLFDGCSSLLSAPNIPASSFGVGSCRYMFNGCYRFESAVLVSEASLKNTTYENIFGNCSGLAYVEIHSKVITSTSLYNWLSNVAATGVLKCDQSLTLPNGWSGLPTGWTRVNLDGTPYQP